MLLDGSLFSAADNHSSSSSSSSSQQQSSGISSSRTSKSPQSRRKKQQWQTTHATLSSDDPTTLCHVLSVCWFGTVPSSHDGFTFTPDRFFLSAILQSLTMYGYGWRCTVKCFTVREIFIKFYEIFQEPLSKYFVPNIFFSEYFATPVTLL